MGRAAVRSGPWRRARAAGVAAGEGGAGAGAGAAAAGAARALPPERPRHRRRSGEGRGSRPPAPSSRPLRRPASPRPCVEGRRHEATRSVNALARRRARRRPAGRRTPTAPRRRPPSKGGGRGVPCERAAHHRLQRRGDLDAPFLQSRRRARDVEVAAGRPSCRPRRGASRSASRTQSDRAHTRRCGDRRPRRFATAREPCTAAYPGAPVGRVSATAARSARSLAMPKSSTLTLGRRRPHRRRRGTRSRA